MAVRIGIRRDERSNPGFSFNLAKSRTHALAGGRKVRKKLFTQAGQAHVIWQTAPEGDIPNEAIAIHVDAGGTICIEQDSSTVCLNKEAVPELCKLLKELANS